MKKRYRIFKDGEFTHITPSVKGMPKIISMNELINEGLLFFFWTFDENGKRV